MVRSGVHMILLQENGATIWIKEKDVITIDNAMTNLFVKEQGIIRAQEEVYVVLNEWKNS